MYSTTARYSAQLLSALDHFRQLLANPHSKSWKPISPSVSIGAADKGKSRAVSSALQGSLRSLLPPSPSDLEPGLSPLLPAGVVVHRKSDKERGGSDTVRAVAEVWIDESKADEVLERARAMLGTGELRTAWDKLVDGQTTLELLDPQTRVVKTDYRLGWPASPRDTITISRTFLTPSPSSSSAASSSSSSSLYSPGSTLIDLSTSLPRLPDPSDEPSFLRPAPPFVRAQLHLGAWGLQVLPPPSSSSSDSNGAGKARLRITLFWQWNLRLSTPASASTSTSGASSSASSQAKHAQELLSSFVGVLRAPVGVQLPLLRGYGRGVEMNRDEYDVQGETRTVEYAVVQVAGSQAGESGGEVEEEEAGVGGNLQGLDELARRRERRRLERAVEISLPPLGVLFPPLEGAADGEGAGTGGTGDGWDVRVTVKALGGSTAASTPAATPSLAAGLSSSLLITTPTASGEIDTSYTVSLSAPTSSLSSASLTPAGRLTLRLTHPALLSPSHLLRCSISIQRLAGGRCVRLNGEKKDVERVDALAPSSLSASRHGVGAGDWDTESMRTTSSEGGETEGGGAGDSAVSLRSFATGATASAASAAAARHQALHALLRRSYIYFLSLLQEPPQKWRHVSDSSGVSVTQLLSPDPTLTIYRAEAVFVGVGVWDVYATVVCAGVRRTWEKGFEGAEMVGDEEGGEGEDGHGEEGREREEGSKGLSELWWEKRKGQWPVAPRDSILLRTSYKSPSSIHVFSSSPPSPSSSSSSDDDSLFPHLPPPAAGTIRTHTDLSGWSIEALSPTTTQITLLDQSDPMGWSSKSSWTPGAMIQAVAGVRDWAIRNGAPPVVTRLSGGVRKIREEYEPEKAQLRVEYAPYTSSSSSAALPAAHQSPPTSPDLSTTTPPPAIEAPSTSSSSSPSSSERTELEIRCDASVWASSSPSVSPSSSSSTFAAAGPSAGIEVLIDPPPLSVACLSRHRLSAGGGLWLTIEHAKATVVREGKVAVTVRRTGTSSASASGGAAASGKGATGAGGGGIVVTVNGAKVKVDVEVLDDEKVRQLEKRKRVKARPVPLDQYETLGPRSGVVLTPAAASAAVAAGSPVVSKTPATGKEEEKEGGEKEGAASSSAAATGVTDDPQAGLGVSTGDGATTVSSAGDGVLLASDLTASNPTSDALASSPPPSAPKPSLSPPACALEALALLQTFHAEQGPELTDPAPGWAIVSERGGAVVRKKVLPRLVSAGADLPVFRGDKIVQGLTADEIAAVVSAPTTRKSWDDRVETSVSLASYGHGISTSVVTTKPVFPFKGRIFYLAAVNASVKVPSASSSASTSTVRFIASASYTPPAPSSSSSAADSSTTPDFDATKVNPLSLPSGTVYLEGWILETLDPYTSSVLAIPSTRCTYVACIDPKLGNLALGLGNVNLARTISNVEQFGKTRGALPRLVSPTEGVQIEGPLSDDGEVDCVWRLQKEKGEAREVVTVDYDPVGTTEGGAYRALFRIGGKGRERAVSVGEEEAARLSAAAERKQKTLVGGGSSAASLGKGKPPSLLSPSLPVGSPLLRSELPRSVSLNFSTAAPPVLQKTPITSELARKTSHSSLRSRSPPTSVGVSTAPSSVSSVSTIVPPPKTTSGGSTTITDPGVHDIVVAELVIDLKQYPDGYSIVASSLLLSASLSDAPLSLEPLPSRSQSSSSSSSTVPPTQIPLRCTTHDAPLPSILTASLDAWKRANHLVRVLIPTGAITHPIVDPLRNPSSNDKDGSSSSSSSTSPTRKPEWYRLLTEGEGALVELKIVPLSAPPPSLTAAGKAKERERARAEQEAGAAGKVTGQAARSAVFNGEKVVVLSQKESRVVLARFEDDDAPLQGAKISRVPPRKRRKGSVIELDTATAPPSKTLPLDLQQPLAIASRLLAPKTITPVVDDYEFPDPKSPGSMTPAEDVHRSPVLRGKAALKTPTSRRDTVSSDTSVSGPLLNILNSYPLSRLSNSVINAAAPVVITESTVDSDGHVATRRTYTLSFVLLVGIIGFLLGSLLRSLLTPADYVVYRSESSAAHSNVEQALLQAFDTNRHWREARRLLELRLGWWPGLRWDLIVAAVKRE